MVLPIYAYGHPLLRKEGEDIDNNYPGLDKLIDDMFETMYATNGVGLAAHQVGKPIRLFVIDASPFAEFDDISEEEKQQLQGKKVFINAEILEETGEKWTFNEGCLSFPNLHEDVVRHERIKIVYLDRNFNEHTEVIDGLLARVIQHEYDHTDGILFSDHFSAFKKRLIKRKLENIKKGKINVDYRMKFYNK